MKSERLLDTRLLALQTLIAAAFVAQPAISQEVEVAASKAYSPYVNHDYPENLYWGDTHLHTNRSVDAYSFGNRLTADIAYRFARGETVQTQGGQPVRIGQPLDFLVVSDHAHYLGVMPLLEASDQRILATPIGKHWKESAPDMKIRDFFVSWGATVSRRPETNPAPAPENELNDALRQTIWNEVTAEADRYNDPGVFTAFIGFEWTSMPDTSNLHRVVIFRDSADKANKVMPISVTDSRDPEDLWSYLEHYEQATSGKALAIPHNGNMSRGLMFTEKNYDGDPLTAAYAKTRARWEPIYEVTQVKGDGETHAALSPDDLFADYETWASFTSQDNSESSFGNEIIRDTNESVEKLTGEYARSALKLGLKIEEEVGANPYKFGLIGSSDVHTSMSTIEENNFFSKMPFEEPSADRADKDSGLFATKDYAAAGLAAVWAHENTRESLFDAMQRRETYATTGPRIALRFFGGWDFDDLDHAKPNYVDIGYSHGVPMGGDLAVAPEGKAPRFLIVAAKDPGGANLERLQIVKGWVDTNGDTQEKVWDVALSDQRKPKKNGKMTPPIKSTVDLDSATYTNTVGEEQLATVWEDPSFNPGERAFYYARVLEIPTPRWTTYDAAFFERERPDGVAAEQQERAYSSPIWYTP